MNDDDEDDDGVRLTDVACAKEQNRKKKSHRKMYAKWSEEEKDALLQGVVTYGVGASRAKRATSARTTRLTRRSRARIRAMESD